MSMILDLPESLAAPWEAPVVTDEPENREASEADVVSASPASEAQATESPQPQAPTPETLQPGEFQLLDQIYEAETQARKAAASKAEAERALADASEWLDDATKHRDELLEKLPAKLIAMRSGAAVEEMADQGSAAETGRDPGPQAKGAGDWRAYPTSELVAKGITGLGDKKAEALIDAFPTLGKLEDARGEASRNNRHFSSVLPKGIGKAIADEIEEQMLTAITKLQAGSGETQAAADSTSPDGRSDSSDETEADDTVATDQKEDQHLQWVHATVHELRSSTDPDALRPKADESMWKEGHSAACGSVPVTECPMPVDSQNPELRITREELADWIRGWLRSSNESDDENDASEPTHEVHGNATDVPAGSESTLGIDARVEQLRSDDPHELRAQNDREAWREGYETAIDDLPVESCPHADAGDSQDDWIRGWLAGVAMGTDEL